MSSSAVPVRHPSSPFMLLVTGALVFLHPSPWATQSSVLLVHRLVGGWGTTSCFQA